MSEPFIPGKSFLLLRPHHTKRSAVRRSELRIACAWRGMDVNSFYVNLAHAQRYKSGGNGEWRESHDQ